MKNPRRNGTGNVFPEERGAEGSDSFRPGDFISITHEALKMGAIKDMGPRLLHADGWENRFEVVHVHHTEQNGECVTLFPCCFFLRNWKTKGFRCKAHPVIYFELAEPRAEDVSPEPKEATAEGEEKPASEGVRGKKGKSSSLTIPFLGELVGFDYDDDHENPRLTARFIGKSAVFTGEFARMMKTVIEAQKVM
jgi:hypothetical protein